MEHFYFRSFSPNCFVLLGNRFSGLLSSQLAVRKTVIRFSVGCVEAPF